MTELARVAPSFVDIAHRIVWASVATVDGKERPRSRVLHPVWQWDGERLVGWIATDPGSPKARDLAARPFASVNYWAANHDTCTAECEARLLTDDETCTTLWDLFVNAPAPLGYDPSIVPRWNHPTDDAFAALRLDPFHLQTMPGTVMLTGQGELLRWSA